MYPPRIDNDVLIKPIVKEDPNDQVPGLPQDLESQLPRNGLVIEGGCSPFAKIDASFRGGDSPT